MRRRLALCLGVLLWPPLARGAAINAKLRELEEVRAQLELKKKEVESYKRLQEQLQRDLSRLKSEKESSERMISELKTKRRTAERKRGELAEKLAALTMAEGKGLRLLSDEINGYFRHAWSQGLRYGRRDLWEESFRRAAIREKTSFLAGLRAFETETAQARTRAAIHDRELSQKARQAMAELRSRQDNYQRKRVDYDETSTRVSRTLREVQELEESARALTGLIKNLERRAGLSARGAAPQARHSWPWPVSGRLASRFGKERVPELKTWVIHNGIEILAPEGAPVLPVDSGRVLFAGPFRSYGNVIIVDHGGALFSIYGRLKEILAKKGDAVDRRSPIASVGATARGGGLLYFEIRRGGEALDPLGFLRR